MKTDSHKIEQLILRCDVCGETRTLSTLVKDGEQIGHPWDVALSIADDFDALHDETCPEVT